MAKYEGMAIYANGTKLGSKSISSEVAKNKAAYLAKKKAEFEAKKKAKILKHTPKYGHGLKGEEEEGETKPVLMTQSIPGAMYQTDPETGIQYEIDPNTFKRTGKTIQPEGTPAEAKVEPEAAEPEDTRWKPNATERNKKGEIVPTKATRKYRKKHNMPPMEIPKYQAGFASKAGGLASGIGGIFTTYGANAGDKDAMKMGGTIAGAGSTMSTIGGAFDKQKAQNQQSMMAKYGMRYKAKKKK